MSKSSDKNDMAAKESGWQKEIITKQQYKDGLIPHPAAAPMSTDQEAGGAISAPEGDEHIDR